MFSSSSNLRPCGAYPVELKMESQTSAWFTERTGPTIAQQFGLRSILYQGRSRFQTIEIFETFAFGKMLVLDGKVQSSEKDEFIYHEALVHPAMITHPNPERVFVAGGGEGATLREVLVHNTVKKVTMVDIDEEVIRTCRELLPSFHQGSFDDPRAEVIYIDAQRYLRESEEKFDVIILDLPDPIEEGPAYLLYTQSFYRLVKSRLKKEGILCLQSGSTCVGMSQVFTAVNHTLSTVFAGVFPYQTDVPAFSGAWGFSLASESFDPRQLSSEEIDRRILSRCRRSLRFYDGLTHQGLFCLPKHIREELGQEKRVITENQPIFA